MERTSSSDKRYERGRAIFDAIGGDHGKHLVDLLEDSAPELARQMISWGFGDVYARPGLESRDRQLVTLGILTALGGTEKQLDVHVRASLNAGLSASEILEVVLHAAVYCGFPRAISAALVARAVFTELGCVP